MVSICENLMVPTNVMRSCAFVRGRAFSWFPRTFAFALRSLRLKKNVRNKKCQTFGYGMPLDLLPVLHLDARR